MVSYALPALIAIGQLIHARRPSWNAITRALRGLAGEPALRKLESIQPASGGFLEAVPLTSFVVMSLAALGHGAHPVATRGLQFIADSARADGSWPIDTHLATWVTTLSANALSLQSSPAVKASRSAADALKVIARPAIWADASSNFGRDCFVAETAPQ